MRLPYALAVLGLAACDDPPSGVAGLAGTYRAVQVEDNLDTPLQQPADVTAALLCATPDAGPTDADPCWLNAAEFDFDAQQRFRFFLDHTQAYERQRGADRTSRGSFFVDPAAGTLSLSYDGAPQWSAILYRFEAGGVVLEMTSAFANGLFGRPAMRGTTTRIHLRPR